MTALDTAGVRCLWHAGGTAGGNCDAPHLAATAPSLARRVRAVLAYQSIVGKSPEGLRQLFGSNDHSSKVQKGGEGGIPCHALCYVPKRMHSLTKNAVVRP